MANEKNRWCDMFYSVSEWDFYWWDLNYKLFDLCLGVKWWMVDLVWSWMVALRRMPKQNLCWIGMFQTEWLEGKYQVSIKFTKSYVIAKTSCLGSSSTWSCRILDFEYLFWFFPLRLPASNIRYSKFDTTKMFKCSLAVSRPKNYPKCNMIYSLSKNNLKW